VPNLSPSASAEESEAAVRSLGKCLRELVRPGRTAVAALEYYKVYQVPAAETPLSKRSDAELDALTAAAELDPVRLLMAESPEQKRLRDQYNDAELKELLALVERRNAAFARAEASIAQVIESRPHLLDAYAGNSRYALLKIFVETRGDRTGRETALRILPIVTQARLPVPTPIEQFPSENLHPFGISALVPDEGYETNPISRKRENPYTVVAELGDQLGGSPDRVRELVGLYSALREQDNPPLPVHPAPAPGSIRVAVMDTGVDWINHPELAAHLGPSSNFADGDANPFMPAVGVLGHGSGTSASILKIIQDGAPELLADDRIELSMWKVASLRSAFVGAPFINTNSFDKKALYSVAATLLAKTELPASEAPRVLSISMSIGVAPIFNALERTAKLVNAPWLWVMAAGNGGFDIARDTQACLADLPLGQRPDARLLCVGALTHTSDGDKIASYSNYGARVDVYAFESYVPFCPNGTSCATPAVAGAAAAIAAKYPQLTPEQIKRAIVEASVERELEVDPSATVYGPRRPGPVIKRTVRVFDPATQLPAALAAAAR
jgi:hypothetical protein